MMNYPAVVPVFPMANALLLPGGDLPLQIFEPRYVAMLEYAFQYRRLMAVVQYCADSGAEPPSLYTVGCLGRIVAFEELEEDRFFIRLEGVHRFDAGEEVQGDYPFRMVKAVYDRFGDYDGGQDSAMRQDWPDRAALLALLRVYFARHEMEADWAMLDVIPMERLFTTLAMACPFSAAERQAIIETLDYKQQAHLVMTILELAVRSGESSEGVAALH